MKIIDRADASRMFCSYQVARMAYHVHTLAQAIGENDYAHSIRTNAKEFYYIASLDAGTDMEENILMCATDAYEYALESAEYLLERGEQRATNYFFDHQYAKNPYVDASRGCQSIRTTVKFYRGIIRDHTVEKDLPHAHAAYLSHLNTAEDFLRAVHERWAIIAQRREEYIQSGNCAGAHPYRIADYCDAFLATAEKILDIMQHPLFSADGLLLACDFLSADDSRPGIFVDGPTWPEEIFADMQRVHNRIALCEQKIGLTDNQREYFLTRLFSYD